MLEADEYLLQAVSNFQLAEAHLKDTEEQLRRLVDRLEDCSEIIKRITKDEPLLREPVDTVIQDNQPVGIKELEPVGY